VLLGHFEKQEFVSANTQKARQGLFAFSGEPAIHSHKDAPTSIKILMLGYGNV